MLLTFARASCLLLLPHRHIQPASSLCTDLGDLEELTSLEKALSGRILEVSLARGQVAVADAAARFGAGLERQAAGKAAAGKGKER
jgi:hypothetical protein